MTQRELPEDLSQWPRDAFQLLGVARDVDAREAKRAYTGLIRKYKPDIFPEHFRRIREAYDNVLERRQAAFAAQRLDQDPIPASGSTPSPADARSQRSTSPAFAAAADEQAGQLWRRAMEGEIRNAYDGLVKLQRAHPSQWHVAIRLYWLLKLEPELDSRREPAQWLVDGMEQTHAVGQLLELYCTEMTLNPREGAGRRAERVLQRELSAAELHRLSVCRWKCCAQLGSSEQITADLERLAPRLANGDSDLWLRTVLAAMEQLAWLDDAVSEPSLIKCWAEIDKFPELQLPLEDELGRCDFLLDLARERRMLLKNAAPLLQAVASIGPLTWTRHVSEVRPVVMDLSQRLLADWGQALKMLDIVNKRACVTLHYLHGLLGKFHQPSNAASGRDNDSQGTRGILAFFDSMRVLSYPRLRLPLLTFCIDENLDPHEVSRTVAGHPAYRSDPAAGEDLAARIHDDGSLSLLWKAHGAFYNC